MSRFAHRLVAVVTALSLCSVPAAAIAVPATSHSAANSNSWLVLSAMTTGSAAASSAAAAAQGDREIGFPPWPALAAILATIALAVFIVAQDDDGDLDLDLPVSPS